jgi:N-acetyl-alpha-D-glucosaminyl L-malate synthase BshA
MALAAQGNQVHFITSGHPARLRGFDENVFLHTVETGEYPLFQGYTPYSLSLAVKIREVAVQYDLDLVHVHYAIPHAASAFLAKAMMAPRPLPTVTTLHGTDITLVGVMPSFYEITRFSISASDSITAVSEFLRKETITEFKVDKPISVIHNFVDSDEFRPDRDEALRRRLAPAGERLLVHVSNFRKVKNLPAVVEVFAGVREETPSRLLLIGDGPELEATERQVHELGLREHVVFMGDQEYVAAILPVCDVFLLPSEHESFGLAALEAMSCGVPVVGSHVGGLHEVIVDGLTGYLCNPRDVPCMIQLVRGLLEDEGKRAAMGAEARKRAVEHFAVADIVREYMDVYRGLMES